MATLKELKADAYDCLAVIEAYSKKLKDINDQISVFKEEPKSEVEGEVIPPA